jgi:hypothetical protein
VPPPAINNDRSLNDKGIIIFKANLCLSTGSQTMRGFLVTTGGGGGGGYRGEKPPDIPG